MDSRRFAACCVLAATALACDALVGVDFGDAQLDSTGAPDGSATGPSPTQSPNGQLCQPRTCAELGRACGISDDGCGNAIDCGQCATGACQDGQCHCVPTTCPAAGVSCDSTADGCGNVLDCGHCTAAGDRCTDGKCGCVPTTCAAAGITCGQLPDGCGGTLDCGGCSGDTPNCNAGHCAAEPCSATTCEAQGKNCDLISDGCGGTLGCGSCAAPQSCGGAGVANVCGCAPLTCAQLGASCGDQPDGCGGTVHCGGCAAGTCGGGGDPKSCGCTASPTPCAGKNCGVVDDGCGTQVACGTCVAPDNTCSGNVCSCVSTTCRRTCIDNCGDPCDYGLCGEPTCFAAGTQIRLADGTTRPIEQVRVGDLLATYDPTTKEVHAARVTETMVHEADRSPDELVVVDGRLRVTPNHPLLVNGQRVLADALRAGDTVLSPTDLSALRTQSVLRGRTASHPTVRVERVHGAVRTYDLRTEDEGGFFADDIVVLLKQEP